MSGAPLRLVAIRVENLGVLRDVTLSPSAGLTVLSGESGAGKSLLIRAIDAGLGGRAESERVGPFGDRARVTLEFEADSGAELWSPLEGFGVEPDETLLVTREWGRDSRAQLRVQGRSVPQGVVRQIFWDVIELVGQHDRERLFRRDHARRWLDGHVNEALRLSVADAWHAIEAADRERKELEAAIGSQDLIADLRGEVAELQALDLQTAAEENLRQEAERLQHGERLLAIYREAADLLDAGGTLGAAAQMARLLSEARRHDPGAVGIQEVATQVEALLEDMRRDLYRLVDSVEFDDRRLEIIRERLDKMARLARRYGSDPADLGGVLSELEDKLARLEQAEWRLSRISREREQAWSIFSERSQSLSDARSVEARRLSEAVTEVIRDLDMPGAGVEVVVEPGAPSQFGVDRVGWRFRPAPGAEWKDLQDAASGGELARLTLALTVAGTERTLMIFDEVDAGLGGHAARRVAELMDRLRQGGTAVLAVTHQAVVAATADRHFRAAKIEAGEGLLEARLEEVGDGERERELARMLSGSFGDAALEHARRLLEGTA